MKGYPVFLVGLDRRRCVVIGGGSEAERKVLGLLECDAMVTVVAPDLTEELRALADERQVVWVKRDYRAGDLEGAFLVIAADQRALTRSCIWEEAEAEGALVNVMDDVDHCNFIAGCVVRRGPLTVAISTNGCAPALAVRVRERLEREFGSEYAEFLDWMAALREPVTRRYSDLEQRRKLWYRLVDSDILEQLRAGRRDRALERLEEIAGTCREARP